MASSLRDRPSWPVTRSLQQHHGFDVGDRLGGSSPFFTPNCIVQNGIGDVAGIAGAHCQGPAYDWSARGSVPYALNGFPFRETHGGIQRDSLFGYTGTHTCVDSTSDHLCASTTMTDMLARQNERLFDTLRAFKAGVRARAMADAALQQPSALSMTEAMLGGCAPNGGDSGQRAQLSGCAEPLGAMQSLREMATPLSLRYGNDTMMSGTAPLAAWTARRDPRHPRRQLFCRNERAEQRAADYTAQMAR